MKKTINRVNKLIITLLLAVLVLLCGCNIFSGAENEPTPGVEIASKDLPRLLIVLPSQMDEFYTEGYEYFLAEVEGYGLEDRFIAEAAYYDGVEQCAAIFSAENSKKYNWIYLHLGSQPVDDQLRAALESVPDETEVVVFGENMQGFVPDYHSCIDYREMGKLVGGRIMERFESRDASGKLRAILFKGDEPWFEAYLAGLNESVGERFDFVELSGEAGAATANYLDSLSSDELKNLCAVVAGSAQTGKAAMESVLSFKGSLNLRVELVAFVGADAQYIEDFGYSPIDEITFDVYPTMMVKTARYLREVIHGEAEADQGLAVEILDKDNIEMYKLSDEFLLRYQQARQ